MANESLDPYYRWLGIPAAEQPANHYRLLGLTVFESDPEVIEAAAMRQMAHVRSYALGPHGELSQEILSEIADAKLTLLDPTKKRKYDEALNKQTRQASTTRHVICPSCAVNLMFNESSFGTQVRCSQCKAILQIAGDGSQCSEVSRVTTTQQPPQASPLEDYFNSDLPSFPTTKTQEPSTKRFARKGAGKRKSNSSWILAIAVPVGGVSGICLAVVILWVAFKKDPLGIIVTDANLQQHHSDAANSESLEDGESSSELTQRKLDSPLPAITPFNTEQAKALQDAWAEHMGLPRKANNSIGMRFVVIPPGEFTMGADVFDEAEQPTHKVTLTKPIELGQYEVTQREFAAVFGSNPSQFKSSDNPVESVSWDDAVTFCRLLSELPTERAAGYKYRLPTESEWEFACRAGTETDSWFGREADRIDDAAFINENSMNRTHSVGQKKANPWGLYDMNGNVSEWCQDYYAGYSKEQQKDPIGPLSPNVETDVRVLIHPFSNSTRTANSSGVTRTEQILVPPTAVKTKIGVIRSPDHAPDTMGIRHAGKYGWINVNGKRIVSCARSSSSCKACRALPDHIGYDITSDCTPGETIEVQHRHRQISPSLGIRIKFDLVGRVHRGGSFDSEALECRSAARGTSAANRRSNSIGFRVVRVRVEGIP